MGTSELTARWAQNTDVTLPLLCSHDGSLLAMTYQTEQVHLGRFFFASYYNAALANAGTLDMLIVTGATASMTPHLGIMVSAGGSGVLSVYEAPTYSGAGTAVTVFNANRQSAKVSTTTITQTPTITGTGTAMLPNIFVPGGSRGNAVGSTSGNFAQIPEFVLAASNAYLVRFTNNSGSATAVSMQLGWFEDV